MNLLEKIDYRSAFLGIKNRKELSEIADIPYSTLSSMFNKGYEKTKMSTLQKIARALDCSMDYLVRDDIEDPHYGLGISRMQEEILVDSQARRLLTAFRVLNAEGKEKALDYIEDLAAMDKYKNSNITQMVDKTS